MSLWERIKKMTIDISAPIERLIGVFVEALPTMLTFLAVVIGGLLLAPFAARLTRSVVQRSGLETLLERFGAPRLLYRVGYKQGTASLLGTIARFAIYLFTALIAADILGMTQVANGLDVLIGYLPRVAVAIVFLMIGMWGADLARSVATGVSGGEGSSSSVIGTIIYYGVMAITVALVADQLGLETSLINNIILLVIAAACLAAAIGAGLSARPTLANLLARNYVAQLYPRGDRIVIDGVEGIVKSHAPTVLVVVGNEQTYNIPYVRFMEVAVETSGAARPIRKADPSGGLDPIDDDDDA